MRLFCVTLYLMTNTREQAPWLDMDPADRDNEEWRSPEVAPTHEVSNYGRVRWRVVPGRSGRIVAQTLTDTGATVGGAAVPLMVRVLVAQAWQLKKAPTKQWISLSAEPGDSQLANLVARRPPRPPKPKAPKVPRPPKQRRRRCAHCRETKPLDEHHFAPRKKCTELSTNRFHTICLLCKPPRPARPMLGPAFSSHTIHNWLGGMQW